MNLGNIIKGLLFGGIVLLVGLAAFPGFHSMLNQVSTSNFGYVLTVTKNAIPYAIVIIILYAVLWAFARGKRE